MVVIAADAISAEKAYNSGKIKILAASGKVQYTSG